MNQFLNGTAGSKYVQGLGPITPSSSTPDYVSMKGHQKLDIIISVDNGATVTGSAITLLQAQDVSATGAKALAFTTYYANTDTGASDTLTATTASSNTFTTDNTNAKNLLYVIEVDANDLDTDNNFDCVRAGTGNGANMVLDVVYRLHGQRYGSGIAMSAITD